MKALDYTLTGASLFMAFLGFIVVAVFGNKEAGSQLFMIGFSAFCLYSVVSSLLSRSDESEGPMQTMGGKLAVFGFGIIAFSFSLNFFLGIRSKMLVLLGLIAFVSMVVGTLLLINDHF